MNTASQNHKAASVSSIQSENMSTSPINNPAASLRNPTLHMGKEVQSAEMISQGGREGSVEAPNNRLMLHFDKTGQKDALTPEMLFAGAYAACYHGALLHAATRAHHTVVGSTVIARVSLNENAQGGYYLAVELRASLPGLNRNEGEQLMHQAHQTCPYSQATRGNVEVTLRFD